MYRCKPIGGSNPPLSASFSPFREGLFFCLIYLRASESPPAVAANFPGQFLNLNGWLKSIGI